MRWLLILLGWLCGLVAEVEAARPPNIVIILCDDMGFSDVGCFGGEIATPNLDRLAENGLRFTQFYNTGRCCPTRAALLTGLYSHQAGVGHMTEDKGDTMPGYRGHLQRNCVTIGEVLRKAGYFTAVCGKWHVGHGEQAWWPLQRGFDRFYGVPQGGGFYFKVTPGRDVVEGNSVVYSTKRQTPDGWYSTDAWTEAAMKYIKEAGEKGKPFFLYLAHNAPHFPLQAPEEETEKYLPLYADGWDPIRAARWQKQQQMGLATAAWKLSPRDVEGQSWLGLKPAARAKQQKAMAIYAAMVEHMDRSIGKLVEFLKQRRALDNTVILFLSDNGGCAEGGVLAVDANKTAIEEWGSAESFLRCGKLWANAQNTPFREYKHYVHEGGISSPLIAHWPQGIAEARRGSICRTPAHVIDLMATCVELGQAEYPSNVGGYKILPMEGNSLVPLFHGSKEPVHSAMYWEHEGNRAIRVGDWKLVARHEKPWELYDLRLDRSELNNMSFREPERTQALAIQWERWAKASFVLPWNEVKKK